MSSYRVCVHMPDGEQVRNGMRYATFKEADSAGFDLMCRWFAPERYSIEQETAPDVWETVA